MNDTCTFVGAIVLIIVAVAIALGMPFAQIWAVNLLFGTSIKYTLINWFAVAILNSSIKISTTRFDRKKQ